MIEDIKSPIILEAKFLISCNTQLNIEYGPECLFSPGSEDDEDRLFTRMIIEIIRFMARAEFSNVAVEVTVVQC